MLIRLPSRHAVHRATGIVLVAALTWTVVSTATILLEALRLSARFGSQPITVQMQRLLARRPLGGEAEKRINILLLGMRGRVKSTEILTDSLLLLSVYPELQRAALLPIPRDLTVPFPDGGRRKINHAYQFGEEGGQKHGLETVREIVGATFGIPVHYAVVVDFAGFLNLIDDVGGVWINVERSFSDYDYPGLRDIGLKFTAGLQWMDGSRALQFARSRHGDNLEGSDFSRSRRQQMLLSALRARLLSWDVWVRPWVLHAIAGDIARSVKTNLEPWEMASLARMLGGVRLESLPGSVLVDVLDEAHAVDGAYELVPHDGTLERVQFRVRNLLVKPKMAELQQLRAGECGAQPELDETAPPSFILVPRSGWDVGPPPPPPAARQEIHGIIIHHDAVNYPAELSGEDRVRSLLRSVFRMGWRDVPYHYLIDVDGRVFEGAPEWAVTPSRTWHDAADLLQVALLGNYSRSQPSAVQLQSLIELVERKASQHHVMRNRISLHSDLIGTECPGPFVRERLTPRPWCPPPETEPSSQH